MQLQPRRGARVGGGSENEGVLQFQAAGFAVSRLDDVPGMAVMRTVAPKATSQERRAKRRGPLIPVMFPWEKSRRCPISFSPHRSNIAPRLAPTTCARK